MHLVLAFFVFLVLFVFVFFKKQKKTKMKQNKTISSNSEKQDINTNFIQTAVLFVQCNIANYKHSFNFNKMIIIPLLKELVSIVWKLSYMTNEAHNKKLKQISLYLFVCLFDLAVWLFVKPNVTCH